MLDFFVNLFDAAQFVPHGMCLLWRPDLLILHGGSDLLISLAYLTIPFIILKAVNRRPDLIDVRVARLFAAFILACALSHLSAMLTLWVPAYGLQGAIKAATAAISIYTALQLARLLPEFLTMPSRKEMASKQAEVELQRRMKEEALEVKDKLNEFAQIASHDLRAPMRGIANQTRFLIEDHGDELVPKARQRLDRMLELCRHLDNLVNTLLTYSLIGRSDANEVIRPDRIVQTIIERLHETLTEHNAKIEIVSTLPEIRANPSDVMTVLQNLIVNGLKYNESPEKRIEIGFAQEVLLNGETLNDVFFVRDNGIGIDAEFQTDIFRMFKRLNQDEDFGDGTGAGLSFVKKTLESNGGSIHLKSSHGCGSTFYFSFVTPKGEKHSNADAPSKGFGDARIA